MSAEPKTCAACGGPIILQGRSYKDFCSLPCSRAGRAFCKECGKPLVQHTEGRGNRKIFCSPLCSTRYYRRGTVSSSIQKERNRATCKACGEFLVQPKSGLKQFCNNKCRQDYHRTATHRLDLLQEWGNFAPEVRRNLREVQTYMGTGAATRFATAIDREYKLRMPTRSIPKRRQPIYYCRTCGKEFHAAKQYGKEYCSIECRPKRPYKGSTKLTSEEVKEIKYLYHTQLLSQSAIAIRYGVSSANIGCIIRGESWVHERVKHFKLTYEQADEICALYATGLHSMDAIGAMYGVGRTTIRDIIKGKRMKPENDPRRKEHQA